MRGGTWSVPFCSSVMVLRATLLLLLSSLTGTARADVVTGPFSCDQDACACVHDVNGVYQTAKDCAYDCCPYWNCNGQQCVPDSAGGYPKSHCAASCGGGYTGYECDLVKQQCAKSQTSHFTLNYCETECGSPTGQSTVVLCAYSCGTGSSKYILQTCLGSPEGNGTSPDCPGTGGTVVAQHDVGPSLEAKCCSDNQFCVSHPAMQCCTAAATFDPVHHMCVPPSGNPPPPPAPMLCNDGSSAQFINKYHMDGGLMECMNYDCSWGAQLCDSAHCSNPTLTGQACPTSSTGMQDPAAGRPTPSTYMGIKALAPQNAKTYGRQVQHSVSWANEHGHYLNLTYDATITHEPIFALDQEAHVLSAKCTATAITLLIHPDAPEQLFQRARDAVFVTGGLQWGCLFDGDLHLPHPHRTIMRRVLAVDINGRTATLKTTTAKYDELFEHAEVHFSTNYLPKTRALHQNSPIAGDREAFRHYREGFEGSEPRKGRKLLGFWGSLVSGLSSAWHAVTTIAEDVTKVVEAIPKVVKAIVTGDYVYNDALDLASISWNYDDSAKTAKDKDLALNHGTTCTECYANFDVSLNVDLSIQSFSLKHTAAYLEGQAAMHINATTDVAFGGDASFDVVMAVLKLPDVDFTIGPVPFVIQTQVPVHAGAEYTLFSAKGGTVNALAHLDGDIKYGVQYTPDDGFQLMHTHTFSHHGGLSSSHIEIGAVAKVYVMPVIVVNIDHIGGPNVGLKGFVQTSIDFKEDGSMCSPTGGMGTSFTTAWGLQLTLGAHLNISFVGHDFLDKSTAPAPIWSHQWPLTAGCFDIDANRKLADASGFVWNPVTHPSSDTYAFFEGVQYVGDITIKNDPSCDQLVSIHGGLQFANASEVNGRPGFVGVSLNNNGRKSTLTDYNIGCVGQNYYIADGAKLKYFVQPPEEPSVQYVNCTMGAYQKQGVTLANLEGSWTLSADFSQLTVTPDNPCINPMTLNREKQRSTIMRPKHDASLPDLVWDGQRHEPADVSTVPEQLSTDDAMAALYGHAVRKFN